ncbi:MAG: aminotransferase class IV [Candidatus Nanopelagicaceae bacterium]|nr:aminotransferase class IV [Candidatus Nanopelagicaceae bacterium]
MNVQFPEGNGIFETLKTVKGEPFALGRHIARAKRSARILGIPIPTEYDIRISVEDLLKSGSEIPDVGRLRMTFTNSGEFELLHENLHPWSNPARLVLLDRPVDETSPRSGFKMLPFSGNVACLALARSEGFDDGIRLNQRGEICESSVANLLLLINHQWVTPELASGCLPGITRQLSLEWFEIRERTVSADELEKVESIFLLSSLKELQPVAVLGDRKLKIDMQLAEEFAQHVARSSEP